MAVLFAGCGLPIPLVAPIYLGLLLPPRLSYSELVRFSPNRLSGPAPRFFADVLAKRDLGLALCYN
jgi:hypothetical protein